MLKTILITGASGGIGQALARAYAAPDTHLILQGRDSGRLKGVAEKCLAQGSSVDISVLDLTQHDKLCQWLYTICDTTPPDLVLVNAGVNINMGLQYQGESLAAMSNLIEVNIRAAMTTVHIVLPAMRTRGNGQIALISSLAGYYGLPMTPSYSASKAALKAYGEALRAGLADEGIKINVVMPGYVASDMCDAMPGPKPFRISADDAANRIRRGLERNQGKITFPFPLNVGCWLLAVLPPAMSSWLLMRLGYGIQR